MIRSASWKCFWTSWLFAWVTIIFLPSALLAMMSAEGILEFPKLAFDIADEIAPLAKLLLGGGLAIAFLFTRKYALPSAKAEILQAVILSALVLVVVLAFIPADYSRGFGVGLAGERFAITETGLFLFGSFCAGLLFCLLARRCADRNADPAKQNS